MGILRRLWYLAGRARAARELADEMQAHIDMRADALVDDGVPEDEARDRARREFGNVLAAREDSHHAWIAVWFDDLLRDGRHAIRFLVHSPGFAAVSILALAIGFGANAAIVGVASNVLLEPLAYRDPERLAVVLHAHASPVAGGNYLDLKARLQAFEALGAAELWHPALTQVRDPESVPALRLTADILPMLGVAPQLGRVFSDDDVAERDVLVLSDGLWRRRFGGRSDVIGEVVHLDGRPFEVIGVMPPAFAFAPFWATRAQMWAPLRLQHRQDDRQIASLRLFGRLRQGVGVDEARQEAAAAWQTLVAEHTTHNTGLVIEVTPLHEQVVGHVRPLIVLLATCVGCLLLAALTNVANLQLGRGLARSHEMAVRAALGAGRTRLVRQLVVEGIVLGVFGALLGIGLARLALFWTVQQLPDGTLPRGADVHLDGWIVVSTLVAGVACTVAASVWSALRLTRTALSSATRSTLDARGRRIQHTMVAVQVSLALALLVGAALALRSLDALRHVDPGFRAEGVTTVSVSMSGLPGLVGEARASFLVGMLDDVRRLPGVQSAGAVNHLPLVGDTWGTSVRADHEPSPGPGQERSAVQRYSLPGYVETMGARLIRGRDFAESDARGAPDVAIVNASLARACWPRQDPIGKRIAAGDVRDRPQWLTVVGVIDDMKQSAWTSSADPEIYRPALQVASLLERREPHWASVSVVLRTTHRDPALGEDVRRIVRARAPGAIVGSLVEMTDVVADQQWRGRLLWAVLGVLGLSAIVLASSGIYGVVTQVFRQREREMGIRVALGASPGRSAWLLLAKGMRPVLIGVAMGIGLALAVARGLRVLLFGISPLDTPAFAGAVGLLILAALAAHLGPMRQAARMDVVSTLKHD